jgi:hypothetical protein
MVSQPCQLAEKQGKLICSQPASSAKNAKQGWADYELFD